MTVSNDGDASSAATTLRYYRSTDATVTTSDTEVGTDVVEGLAASATSRESIGLTAPAAAGTYYYGACVDAVAGESATTNNCSGSVQVTVSEPEPPPPPPPQTSPDLTVASPSVNDNSPAPRHEVHAVGDGSQRRGRILGGHDVALLPVDGRDGDDLRHRGGHRRSGGACRVSNQQGVDRPDGAGGGGNLLLRGVRGRGGGRVGHDEQLLWIGAGHGLRAGGWRPTGDRGAPLQAWFKLRNVPGHTPWSWWRGPRAIFRRQSPSPCESGWFRALQTRGVDFGRSTQSVEFNAADFTFKESRYEALKTLAGMITILDDTEAEGDETFGATMTLERARPFVTLSPNYPDQLSITILANDGPP